MWRPENSDGCNKEADAHLETANQSHVEFDWSSPQRDAQGPEVHCVIHRSLDVAQIGQCQLPWKRIRLTSAVVTRELNRTSDRCHERIDNVKEVFFSFIAAVVEERYCGSIIPVLDQCKVAWVAQLSETVCRFKVGIKFGRKRTVVRGCSHGLYYRYKCSSPYAPV